MDGSKSSSPAGFPLSYSWDFGDGSNGTGVKPTHTYTSASTFKVALTVDDGHGGTTTAATTAGISATAPVISDFEPKAGPVGTAVAITGNNLVPRSGTPQVTISNLQGGIFSAPVASFSAAGIVFTIPAGAATGPLSVTIDGNTLVAAEPLTVNASSSFTLAVNPARVTLIRGQSTAFSVSVTSSDGFAGLATLAISGLPSGVTASFVPSQIASGQTSLLTVSAPPTQVPGNSTLKVTASATVDGLPLSQTTTATLSIQGLSTSLLGRTVVDDTLETSIAGVAVTMLAQDGNSYATACTQTGQIGGGLFTTVSDAAGNFSFLNLPAACAGAQLIGYDGSTATSPAGKYAGVNVQYTLVAGQVVVSPVLVHLPRIDNAETFYAQQNAATDQTYSFSTIPGLSVTVYANTTFTETNGTQPNPFPLAAVQVPVDRLPDTKPLNPKMLAVFIVAFQPAETVASQPVAVTFPNVINTPPGLDMPLLTLNPQTGTNIQYGTGAVSARGEQIVPDPDPAHPGHLYGLTFFDWHGPMPAPPPTINPNPGGGGMGPSGNCPAGYPPVGGGGRDGGGCSSCACTNPNPPATGEPVDIASGLEVLTSTDIGVYGGRGSIYIRRLYRSATAQGGPFGIGTSHNYGYALDTAFPLLASVINLIAPDGNRFPFVSNGQNRFSNLVSPAFVGDTMSVNGDNSVDLRFKEGTVYRFAPAGFQLGSFLASITDRNGNTTTVTRDLGDLTTITRVTDAVGRSLNFDYDSSNRITSITDPIGRKVSYGYNSQGTLASVTDPAGGVTQYTYDGSNNLLTATDARGVAIAQNSYDANGRVVQQIAGDGGIYRFSYVLLNPDAAVSPVMSATVTDPDGNQSTYRFDPTGLLTDGTDPMEQPHNLVRDPGHNNLVQGYAGTGVCLGCGPSAVIGNSLSYTLDTSGNVLTITDALGNTSTSTYEPTFNQVTSVTDPIGDVVTFTYDSNGNLLNRTDPNGNTTSYAYNAYGQAIQITDALGNRVKLSYDSSSDLTAASDPLGNTSTFVYDSISRPIQSTDPLGRTSLTQYDALGRVSTEVNPQRTQVNFQYDQVGNLIAVIVGDVLLVHGEHFFQQTTLFTYDASNRLITKTDPLGHTDTRAYDHNGNLTSFSDRRGQTATFVYDALNRLVSEGYADSTVARAYDANGRLSSVSDSMGGAFDYTYDGIGRLLSEATQFGTIQFAYDNASRMTSRQVVGQGLLTYAYDAAGNLLNAALPQASASFAYDGDNRLKTLSRANGVNSSYAYDLASRLLSITHSGGQGINIPLTYAYDPASNRTMATSTVAQPLTTQAVTNTFNDNNQLVSSSASAGATSYSYDANGNLVSASGPGGTTTYTWDSRNRLKSVSVPGQTTAFLYDFARNLIQQKDSGSLNLTRSFVLDDFTDVAFINRSDGDQQSVLAGRSIDSHLGVVHSSGQVEFGLADALNSTVATVDLTGAMSAAYSYEPFGLTSSTNTYPFLFTGRTVATGELYYYRARFYSSQTGRFIGEDPAGLGTGPNLYQYARNDAMRFTDPTGLTADVYLTSEKGSFDTSASNVAVSTNTPVSVSGSPYGVVQSLGTANCTNLSPGVCIDYKKFFGCSLGVGAIAGDVAGFCLASVPLAPVACGGGLVAIVALPAACFVLSQQPCEVKTSSFTVNASQYRF